MNIVEKTDTVYLYPTLKCNLKCSMCVASANLHDGKYSSEELSLVQYKKLIFELYKQGTRIFDISGGEPLLRQDIIEILMEIKKYNDTNVFLVSNGTLWNKDFTYYQQLLLYVDKLYFSIDSSMPAVHDDIRGVEGTFEAVSESIKRIKGSGYQEIYVNTVLSQFNYKETIAILNMAYGLGCKGITFLKLLDVTESSKKMGLVLNEEEYTYVLDQIYKWKIENNERTRNFIVKVVMPGKYLNMFRIHKINNLPKMANVCFEFDPLRGCNAFRKSIVITADGYVTGCTAFLGKESMYVGNVKQETMEAIMNKFGEFRRKIKDREKHIREDLCQKCKAWGVCRGGCTALSLNYDCIFEVREPCCALEE